MAAGGAVGDALEVAIEARTLDVVASPYDLRSYGLEPICREESGRAEFKERQIALMARVQPVRTQREGVRRLSRLRL